MKKIMALLVLFSMPMAALAAEADIYAEVLSAYVYRGIVGNEEAVFQPGLDVAGPWGLGYSLWANMNLTDADEAACPWYPDTAGEWSELNLGLNWTLPWEGPVSFTAGGLYFVYPQEGSEVEVDENGAVVLNEDGSAAVSKAPADGSYEVFAEIAAEDILLSPAIRFCHDLDDTEDWIALLSIGHSFGLTDALSLDLGASLGFAGEYYVEDNYASAAGAAFTHAQLDAGLNYAFNEQASVGIKAGFSSILDEEVRDDIEEGDAFPEVDVFFGGFTASYSF